MANPPLVASGVGLATSLLSSNRQSSAARDATNAQSDATYASIAENARQFDLTLARNDEADAFAREVYGDQLRVQSETRRRMDQAIAKLRPYISGGTEAFRSALALSGVFGAQEQAEQIDIIEGGPTMAALVDAGEEAILQNASATGGLRGGRTQEAVATLRPEILSRLIDQQLTSLTGLGTTGLNAINLEGSFGSVTGPVPGDPGVGSNAAQIGALSQSFANTNADLLGTLGASQAGGALAQGKIGANTFGDIAELVGGLAGQVEVPEGQGIFSSYGWF